MNGINLYPHLILHFDVNKTLICSDSVTGKTAEEILVNQLAETTLYQWDKNCPTMSYKEYVSSVLVEGKESDLDIKKKRREEISQFLTVIQNYPELSADVLQKYELLKEKLTDSVFPSFVKLIDKLKEHHIQFIIVLRSFGNDLEEVEEQIHSTTGISFAKWGKFKDGALHMKGEETSPMIKAHELFKLFTESREHLSINDSYIDWNSNDEKAKYGKKFVFEKGNENHRMNHLSLFFDDNITGDSINDIVAPYTMDGTFVSTEELKDKLLFTVDTGEAIMNDDYYVNLINTGLKKNGYPLKID
ncbi:MAG: hypothetical protein VX777_01750 [Chlamydiota bacterium]|nr:hypothetical protein [Chlamydiota bacterium]